VAGSIFSSSLTSRLHHADLIGGVGSNFMGSSSTGVGIAGNVPFAARWGSSRSRSWRYLLGARASARSGAVDGVQGPAHRAAIWVTVVRSPCHPDRLICFSHDWVDYRELAHSRLHPPLFSVAWHDPMSPGRSCYRSVG